MGAFLRAIGWGSLAPSDPAVVAIGWIGSAAARFPRPRGGTAAAHAPRSER